MDLQNIAYNSVENGSFLQDFFPCGDGASATDEIMAEVRRELSTSEVLTKVVWSLSFSVGRTGDPASSAGAPFTFHRLKIFNLTLSRHILYLFASTGNVPVFLNPDITFSTVRLFFQILAIRKLIF